MAEIITWNNYPKYIKNKKINIDINIQLDQLKSNDKYRWNDFFNDKNIVELVEKINKKLNEIILKNPKVMIFPLPDDLFNAFKYTKFSRIKVVILGQDPYFNKINEEGKIDNSTKLYLPQATGLAFSVPEISTIPPSLENIFKNMVKYGNLKGKPKCGNLKSWAENGCFMLNTSLSVEYKKPNSHCEIWNEFTDTLIKYISDNRKHLVFMLWGAHAIKKKYLINESRHKIICSSHPSGNSYFRAIGKYKSFSETDHFTECNNYLKKYDKSPIVW